VRRAATAAISAAAAAALAGCMRPCELDADCSGGQSCARTHECVDALVTVRVAWTVNGVQPTPELPDPCAGIDHIEISFDDAYDVPLVYTPFECAVPLATFTRMPPRLYRVTVRPVGSDLDAQTLEIPPGTTDIRLDFDLR
jgi:hypothetical protein